MSVIQLDHHPFLNKQSDQLLLIEALAHSHHLGKSLDHHPIDQPTHQTDDHCKQWHKG